MAKIAVAPLVGAWIEIVICGTTTGITGSLPSWERGLKLFRCLFSFLSSHVAPLVGAWIEMSVTVNIAVTSPSLPSWERGLKSDEVVGLKIHESSLPSWERGLK